MTTQQFEEEVDPSKVELNERFSLSRFTGSFITRRGSCRNCVGYADEDLCGSLPWCYGETGEQELCFKRITD